MIIRQQLLKSKYVWPINKISGNVPECWQGWPDGKRFAVIITHDVESSRGMNRCKNLAEIDSQYGFKSSFNIVPYKYPVPPEARLWLQSNGFEVGVHDYNHDGKLYRTKKIFDERSLAINKCLKEWNACGFRSASMHHNLAWIANLEILYDCSTFDTDPFEPQSDGVNTIFPFWYQQEDTAKGFVEIPYTLPQDFTLFVLKKEKSCRIWQEKLKWIVEKGGMATVIVHPDYINFEKNSKNGIDEYSCSLYEDFLKHIKTEYHGKYWNPLPKEFALFVKEYELNLKDPSLYNS